jgi:hypothetical protein
MLTQMIHERHSARAGLSVAAPLGLITANCKPMAAAISRRMVVAPQEFCTRASCGAGSNV